MRSTEHWSGQPESRSQPCKTPEWQGTTVVPCHSGSCAATLRPANGRSPPQPNLPQWPRTPTWPWRMKRAQQACTSLRLHWRVLLVTNINRAVEAQGDFQVGNLQPGRPGSPSCWGLPSGPLSLSARARHCGSLPVPLRQWTWRKPGSSTPSATPDRASYCRPSANAQASRRFAEAEHAPP